MMSPIARIRAFNKQHGSSETRDVKFIEYLKQCHLTTEQIAHVISATEQICMACFDGIAGKCTCRKDW